jgi:hypothetical protein
MFSITTILVQLYFLNKKDAFRGKYLMSSETEVFVDDAEYLPAAGCSSSGTV